MPADYRKMAAAFARRYGIPVPLFLAQINQESGFNPKAKSPKGAEGIAQIVRKWHPGVDPTDPVQSLNYAARLMSQLYAKYGNWEDAWSVYNSGKPWAKGKNIPETRAYVAAILGAAGDAAASAAPSPGAGSPSPLPATAVTTSIPWSREALRQLSKIRMNAERGAAPTTAAIGRLAALRSPIPMQAIQQVGQMAQQASVDATTGFVNVLPTPIGSNDYGYSDPEGQGGKHLAHDWFAPGGTAFVAPVSGTVVRVTPDPSPGRKASGQVFGGTVAVRDAQGRLWVFRHSVPGVKVGQKVTAGAPLGRVKDWTGKSHIHLEAYGPGSSDREYSPRYALNPYTLFGGGR